MFAELQSPLRVFQLHQEIDAVNYAMSGGQALLLALDTNGLRTAGLLLDQDASRLVKLARLCGQDNSEIHREGERFQHVLLRGVPLAFALGVATGLLSPNGSGAAEAERPAQDVL